MGKIKSIKSSMTMAFLIAIFAITIVSATTIFVFNEIQNEILTRRNLTVNAYNFDLDENAGTYIFHSDDVTWQPLSTMEELAYNGAGVAMIVLPAVYVFVGIGATATMYYRKKLRVPILQLQNAVESIQKNDLDFQIAYSGTDELGRLCASMEKMRTELRQNTRALWETLEQRKLLNASVAHDLRTPMTVLKGYLDYLEKNIPRDKLTKEMLIDTVSSMQTALTRLEQYVECVRYIEKVEGFEMNRQHENARSILKEIEKNVRCLTQEKEIFITSSIFAEEIIVDKSALFRILENLLQNAIRYAEHQVTIDISQNDRFLVLTVKDDGKGFGETDLQKAATVFYSTDQEHFGIGLSICKVFCEKHGGLLYINNNIEKGACVTATLKIL